MQLTLDVPDELSEALGENPDARSRSAIEVIAVNAYREHKLSMKQLRRILGFETRMEVDAVLKRHGVELEYTMEDFERDRETLRKLDLPRA